MSQITVFIMAYGELILFLAGFAEQSGLPIPGSLLIIAAGALSANGSFSLFAVIGWTALGCIAADATLFIIGGRGRTRVLAVFPFLQEVQIKLERATLAKTVLHGVRMLTVAKFVPLGQVVAMQAGAMRVNRLRFLLVDGFTSVVYATVYAALGLAFHDQLEQLVDFLRKLGTASLLLIISVAGSYGVYLLLKRRKTALKPSPEQPATANT